jgi:hypothetical protein
MAAYYDVITWESSVYKNTRSHDNDLLVDADDYQNLKLPFWVLEPVFADDFFIYQHARSSIVRAIQKMESLMTDKKTTERVNTLATSHLPSEKKTHIHYRPVLQWIGKTLFYWVWVPDSDEDEDDNVDDVDDVDDDIEDDDDKNIYIVTPWELGTTSPTPVQTAMMKRIENNIHHHTKRSRIVWISSSILFHDGGSEDIPLITSTSSTFDDNDTDPVPDRDMENKNLVNTVIRILLLLYNKTNVIRGDEPVLLPHLKYTFTSLYFKMDRETTTKIAEERTKKAKECFEISQLPYVAEKTRRFCHDHGYFHYNDAGFYGFLKTNVENRNLHHGLSRYTLPWLNFCETSPNDIWQCDRRYLKSMMAEFLDSTDETHYMFVDFETNIYPKENASGYENRIYLCGILHVHLIEGETTSRMESLWSGDPTDPRMELDLLYSIQKSLSVPGAKIFYYSAERGFWKGACQRHGIGMMDPLFRVFDKAYDLLKMVGSCKLLMKNAPNQKLKTLGKAMCQHGITDLKFPEEISGGEDSMAVSKLLYDRLPPASGSVRLDVDVDMSRVDREVEDDVDVVSSSISSSISSTVSLCISSTISELSEPLKEEMKSFVSRFHQENLVNLRNKRKMEDIHSGIYSLFMYNQYDCAILYEIFRFLCSISLMD